MQTAIGNKHQRSRNEKYFVTLVKCIPFQSIARSVLLRKYSQWTQYCGDVMIVRVVLVEG